MMSSRIVAVRIRGRRVHQTVALGFRILVRDADRFWNITVHRNGAVHMGKPPRGWWIDFGNPMGAVGLWLRVDVPTKAIVDIEPIAGGRRSP